MTTPAAERAISGLTDEKRRLVRLLAERVATTVGPVTPTHRSVAPATPMQARLWRNRHIGGGSAGTGSHAFRLHGPLDADALASAISAVVRRHGALRTSFADAPDGTRQVVHEEPIARLQREDLRSLTTSAGADRVAAAQVESAGQSLDLARGDVSRFLLLRLGPDEHVLVLAAHLAVFDGWSSGILLRDISAAYRGTVTPPGLQFCDVAAWQRRWVRSPEGTVELERLRSKLAGATPPPGPPSSFRRGHAPARLDPNITRQAFALGAREGATPFMTLVAGMSVVLTQRSAATDVVIGTPVAGRLLDGVEDVVGQLTTVVPIMMDCSGRPTFRTVLRRARQVVLEALGHQLTPVDTMLEGLREAGKSQPYSVLLALHNYPTVTLDLPGVEVEALPGPPAHHLELYSPTPAHTRASIGFVEQGGGVTGTVEYNALVESPRSIVDLLGDLERVLFLSVQDPDSVLPLLSRPALRR